MKKLILNDILSHKPTNESQRANTVDIEAIIGNSISNNKYGIPHDLKIDDRDLLDFPNFFTFLTSENGLNETPYSRQLIISTLFLSEYCPRCSHPEITNLHTIPVDYQAKDVPEYVQFLEYGVCPKCGATKQELYANNELNIHNELVGIAGQRSGKSTFLAGYILLYDVHRWVKMPNPALVLGLGRNSWLTFNVIAQTLENVNKNLWNPVKSAIKSSVWFQEYFQLLDYYGKKYGIEQYKFNETSLTFNHRNLNISPETPSYKKVRGATRVFAALDEIAYMGSTGKTGGERADPDKLHQAISRSLTDTRIRSLTLLQKGYNNIPMGINICVTSPNHQMDKGMRLYRESEFIKETYRFKEPTWEINPFYPRDHPVIVSAYKKDYKKANSDYGATPPISNSPWIEDIEDIIKLTELGKRNRVSYRYIDETSDSGMTKRHVILLNTKPKPNNPRTILSLDTGLSDNSYGICISKPSKNKGAEILALIEIAPNKDQNIVNFSKIESELLYPLIEEFNVGLVVSDGWQQVKFFHDIEENYGLPTHKYVLTKEDYGIIKAYLTDANKLITLPNLEMSPKTIMNVDLSTYPHCFRYKPVSHLIYQFLTVQKTDKNTVDKGDGFTDDILKSVCLGLKFCLDQDVVEYYGLLENNIRNQSISKQAIGTKVAIIKGQSKLGVKAGNYFSNNGSAIGVRS